MIGSFNPRCCWLLIATLTLAIGCREKQADEPVSNSPEVPRTGESNGTQVVPTLNTPLTDWSNVLWCATFQVAWNRAGDDALGEPLQVEHAEEIASRLNQSEVSAADLPPGSFYAAAGLTDQSIVQTIHAEMKKQFPSVSPPTFEQADGLVAYCYMDAQVKFTTPFEECTLEFTDGDGEKNRVEAFELHHGHDWELSSKQSKQLKLLFQVPEDVTSSTLAEFAIDLTADQEENQLLVAVVPRSETLQETIEHVYEQIAANQDQAFAFEGDEVLRVPNVVQSVVHEFSELEGSDKLILDKVHPPGHFISKAVQSIKFRLDKGGAAIVSEAELEATPAEAAPGGIEYEYVVDRPFLLIMKRRAAKHPYFVAWIDNSEVLELQKLNE
ncbi:hypothetical protein [Aeoliella mucimassa]|uniref:Serpin (Serine protease inhibitor) n=1 Tax=Aeoliella mucimassa TaxID=2527972 RepID=A0A518ALM0_9BACT|nr:hypothetical protein [Aeoliella mucimassa]QDU55596.1 hypothetical protein Pan181_17880 [Aeoliella mucimassa]